MNLAQKLVIAIAIPVLFQIGFFWFLLDSVRKLDQLEKSEREATQVLMLRDQMFVTEGEQLLYYGIYRATLNPEFARKFRECEFKCDAAYEQLFDMWKDNKVRTLILQSGRSKHKVVAGFGGAMVGTEKQTTMSNLMIGATALPIGQFVMYADEKSNLNRTFNEIERSQDELKKEAQTTETELERLLLIGLAASVLISLVFGLLFSHEITGRLRKVVGNITAMEKHQAAMVPIGGADEIAALNRAILDTDKKIRVAEEFQVQSARIVAQELERPIEQLSTSLVDLLDCGFESINDNGKERIDRSAMELQRLRMLAKDLVSLDKISRAGWDLKIESVDLAEIAKAAVDTVQDFAHSLKIEFVCALSPTLVVGDPARMQQIALNLLTNAIKFSKPNRTIEVETKVEGGFGKFSVTDHGTGIPEEFQQSIFGKFEQANRTDSTEKGGSGLGLAISKKLVESQNGKMGFISKLGSGSTFWLTLPVASSANAASEHATAPAGGFLSAGSPVKPSRGFRPTMWRKMLTLVALPLIVQVATIASLWLVVGSIRANVNEFYRASQITSYHSKLLNAMIRSTLYLMVYNVNHFETTLASARKEQWQIVDWLDKLSAVTKSNNVLAENTRDLKRIVKETIDMQNEIIEAPQDANIEKWFGPGVSVKTVRMFNEQGKPLQSAIAYESKLVEGNIFAKMKYRRNVEIVLLVSMLGMFFFSALVGIFMTRRVTSRVQRIVANADRLVAKDPLLEPIAGTDEIAYVDHSFYEAADKLAQLERFKQEIIAITSHEFRTPLTSLLAKTDLMEAGVFGALTKRGKEIVRASKRSIIDLIALITNLLDVEKIQSGKNIVEKAEVSIYEILSRTSDNMAELTEQRDVELRIDADELQIFADRARLVQALTAVLTDIASHAPAQSSINVSAKEQHNQVIVSITAPGGDCSRDSLELTSARGRLAVDLLKLIVEQHGGSVEIKHMAEQLAVEINL